MVENSVRKTRCSSSRRYLGILTLAVFGLWEAHLKGVLQNLGGQEVIEFAGNFDFPENKLLLSTYVDDLNLAGPVDHHQKFWDKLISLVDVELPEPIYRVLGRNHSMVDLPRCGIAADCATSGDAASAPQSTKPVIHMAFDMYDCALQTVDLHKSLTGVEKIQHAATPFALVVFHLRMKRAGGS